MSVAQTNPVMVSELRKYPTDRLLKVRFASQMVLTDNSIAQAEIRKRKMNGVTVQQFRQFTQITYDATTLVLFERDAIQ